MAMSPTSIDIFDTNVLVGVVPNLKTASTFMLDRFFGSVSEFDTEFISVDVEVGKRRMAPFASPLVEGAIVEARRVTTNTFRPAYIKDKRVPDLKRPIRRAIGERIGGGDMTAGERAAANLAYEMADQLDMIQRRLEWMANSAVQFGTVTVTGEGYPTTVVDFGRDSALTVALTLTAKWTTANIAGATATPRTNVQTWIQLVLQKSGAAPTDIVFTPYAWDMFTTDPKVKDTVWYPRSGDSELNFAAASRKGGVLVGMWDGIRCWLYNEWYVDPADNTEKPMLPDKTVILCGPDLMGNRAFGAIMDPEFNYGALAYAPKSWVQKDPAVRLLMMQSAPLVVPFRANHCLCATIN